MEGGGLGVWREVGWRFGGRWVGSLEGGGLAVWREVGWEFAPEPEGHKYQVSWSVGQLVTMLSHSGAVCGNVHWSIHHMFM